MMSLEMNHPERNYVNVYGGRGTMLTHSRSIVAKRPAAPSKAQYSKASKQESDRQNMANRVAFRKHVIPFKFCAPSMTNLSSRSSTIVSSLIRRILRN
jgi:hypothetical protein